ncbi:hypothetical protein DFQ27_000592 [Actinomortierella ambigua]|uniref:Transcriptional coactivator p15 (PC4) C-terminal domain-containing protein n=1 Tax=Actinomortierella ambigua TaxID=1343610 RepID=A0A9P6U9J7_9FUNG|nr:hypothetical protein DFQ26_001012 [Actinomortierella ambigua]KAG0265513.1 hypothetical protein DFQ27_000592 [Actinomortierella ambigua]
MPKRPRQVNEAGSEFYLGPKKRITVRAWKGVPLVDIREYWKDDEDVEKPSKKGISLTADQFRDLLKYADEISNVLDSME